jgi:hypothetical protein
MISDTYVSYDCQERSIAMKKIYILMMASGLLLMQLVSNVQSAQTFSSPPPVSPPLVRQGDFAFSFLESLELNMAYSEAQAMEMLAEIGIEPENGWVSDYPMTPDVIGELQNAVQKTAEKGHLGMSPSEALNVLNNLAHDYGIPTTPGTQYGQTSPPFGYYDYTAPTVVNKYYYHNGPPVITYYPPPSQYYKLYSWNPYPFWWGGFSFSGYFILSDFHRSSQIVVLSRTGPTGLRSSRTGIGVVSSRSKRIHRPKRYYLHPKDGIPSPNTRNYRKYGTPGIKTEDRRRHETGRFNPRDMSRPLRDRQEPRRRFDINSPFYQERDIRRDPGQRHDSRIPDPRLFDGHRRGDITRGFSSDPNRSFDQSRERHRCERFREQHLSDRPRDRHLRERSPDRHLRDQPRGRHLRDRSFEGGDRSSFQGSNSRNEQRSSNRSGNRGFNEFRHTERSGSNLNKGNFRR